MKGKLIKFTKAPAFSGIMIIIATAVLMILSIANAPEPENNTLPAAAEKSIQETTLPETTATSLTSAVSSTQTVPVTSSTASSVSKTSVSTTKAITHSVTSPVSTSPRTTTTVTSSETTSTVSSQTETTTVSTEQTQTETTTYTVDGESPNSSFYQSRIAVAGDSIASGFYYYGLIPFEHNIAKESLSLWNLDYFTFNYGWGELGMIDAADYVHSKLIFMSMGMNDVNTYSAEGYAEAYRELIEQILARVPETNIVVSAITPVGAESSFISNDVIREFNSALADMVNNMGSPRVYYFDSYSVLSDEYGGLRYDCSAGDGIHLQSHCYSDLFAALFRYLDTTPVMKQIQEAEG